jgi:hypothetical protein
MAEILERISLSFSFRNVSAASAKVVADRLAAITTTAQQVAPDFRMFRISYRWGWQS